MIQDILLIAAASAFLLSLIYRFLVNQQEIRKIKEEMKFYREKIKKAQKSKNIEEANRYTNELLKINQKHFRLMMKPLFLSMAIFILLLQFFNSYYSDFVIKLPFSLPFFGNEMGWYVWFIVCIIPFNQLFRKLLGVE